MSLVKRTPNPIDDRALAVIAKQHLDLETLETRRSDSLDFHDLAVWRIRAALEAAFEAGRAQEHSRRAKRRTKETS
jgi:hypothetical protein